MPELVTIPISYFEFLVEYEVPNLRLLRDRADLVQALYEALKPWGINIDDIEPRTTGKPSEQGLGYKLPLKRTSIFCGPSYCKLTRDDVTWESAEETIAILSGCLGALVKHVEIVLGVQKTLIALHLQPRTKSFLEIISPFLSPALAALEKMPVRTLAAIAKWENRKVTIDGSGALVNGVFLRFERDFSKEVTLDQIAAQLKHDEEELFRMLDVEEATA